jgi:hypothetical protein
VQEALAHALRVGAPDEREQLVDMAVDVAVRQEADEVQRGAARDDLGHEIAPGRAPEQRAGGERCAHQLRALIEHPAGAERVVPDLAVAHVGVARHAHRRAVRP